MFDVLLNMNIFYIVTLFPAAASFYVIITKIIIYRKEKDLSSSEDILIKNTNLTLLLVISLCDSRSLSELRKESIYIQTFIFLAGTFSHVVVLFGLISFLFSAENFTMTIIYFFNLSFLITITLLTYLYIKPDIRFK